MLHFTCGNPDKVLPEALQVQKAGCTLERCNAELVWVFKLNGKYAKQL